MERPELGTMPNREMTLAAVRFGEISPSLAEKWVTNMGLEPFPRLQTLAPSIPCRRRSGRCPWPQPRPFGIHPTLFEIIGCRIGAPGWIAPTPRIKCRYRTCRLVICLHGQTSAGFKFRLIERMGPHPRNGCRSLTLTEIEELMP
jgi:hypothetical protein